MKETIYDLIFWFWATMVILITAVAVPIGGGYLISDFFGVKMLTGVIITSAIYYGSTFTIMAFELHRSIYKP